MKRMDQDLRKGSRVSTHIVTEILVDNELQNYCGYIENLSTDGIGVISLDKFTPGDKVGLSFYLIGILGKITPQATLVHSEKSAYNLYYHGFKFDSLTEKERQAIERFIGENALTMPA
jgi:hypothetical protein